MFFIAPELDGARHVQATSCVDQVRNKSLAFSITVDEQRTASFKATHFPRGATLMQAHRLTPILNVSNMHESFEWFTKLGWRKGFEWGSPPSFGSVCSGHCEIFLCLNGQGSRGRSPLPGTFGPEGDETGDKGVWMSVWVEDVDEVHRQCVQHGIEIAWPPTDMPWNVREMHLRHPDGHIFRVSKGNAEG